MKQLSAVIGEQEEAVAVVEANTATALAVTEKGAEDLVTAQAYQRAYRCKWVILTTLILLFVGIMILLHFQFQII
jgi:t-SNARE complex subunit (syntaxin)